MFYLSAFNSANAAHKQHSLYSRNDGIPVPPHALQSANQRGSKCLENTAMGKCSRNSRKLISPRTSGQLLGA